MSKCEMYLWSPLQLPSINHTCRYYIRISLYNKRMSSLEGIFEEIHSLLYKFFDDEKSYEPAMGLGMSDLKQLITEGK